MAEAKLQALMNAALNVKVLLVLDDVWDTGMIDPSLSFLNSKSTTLVTTRIKGLFREEATEVIISPRLLSPFLCLLHIFNTQFIVSTD